MDDVSDSAFDPIILNSWPSCNDCLSWSSDGELAISAGEFVHILTPKHSSKAGSQSGPGIIGLRQWHSTRLRTNLFRQREWPDQRPEPFLTFSIGEEQTMATVVGLAWSPPGIGTHKRSVLAVLTSNHVLSLWGSNGTIGEWKRIIVVNHSLGDYFGWVDEAGQDINRAKRRIRAFAWSPPFRCIKAEDEGILKSKWGVVHLAVANDDEVVTILRLWNEERRDRLELNLEAVCDVRLPTTMASGDSPHVGSLFQKAIMSKSPISNFSWSSLDEESSESFMEVTQRTQRQFIKVRASLQPPEGGAIKLLERDLKLKAVYWENPQGDIRHDPQSRHASANAELDKKMEEARVEFDSHHTLEGNSIVRKWGFASHQVHDAACITLHPSDMVEYTTPSMGKCTLLFARRDEVMDDAHPSTMTMASPTDVLFQVTSWVLSAANQVLPIFSMDRWLLGITTSYAAQMDDEQMKKRAAELLSRLRETSKSQLENDDMAVDEPPPIDSLTAADIETCIICEALILFNEDDLDVAHCESGHQYTRCSLSLLAIQEPGISKYCSRCDRQFLNAEAIDLESMQGSDGPSLVASLFEEFDVCPYCQAKFRG